MTGLMQDIRAFEVPRGSFALWFLGQNGWIVKSPAGFVLAVDPYLTNSCAGRRSYLDQERQVPVFVAPDQLNVDLFVSTHSHRDHADPGTIAGALAAGTPRFMGPAEAVGVFAASGVPEAARIMTWANDVNSFADLAIKGTFALATDEHDLNHMGFVIAVEDGPKLYITGDTAATDTLHTVARHRPDVMIVCINGGFRNLSHWQAAEFVKVVDPKVAIPCHYDMFRDNSCPPHMFKASLGILGVGDKYREMPYATPWVYPEGR